MPDSIRQAPALDSSLRSEAYYRELQRKNVLRLILTYLAPLIILSLYFYFQYQSMLRESVRNHLRTVAENHANTMDLFLQERIANLSNLIDDPKIHIPPAQPVMSDLLQKLTRTSDAFEDIGFIDDAGFQTAYAGAYPELAGKEYAGELWFRALKEEKNDFIVTDVYPGLRRKPHFTIAVSRWIDGRYVVLRSALDPERLYRYFSSLAKTRDADIALVNSAGLFQLVDPRTGAALQRSAIIPPAEPPLATMTADTDRGELPFAYAWLRTCNWALIARPSPESEPAYSQSARINLIAFSAAIIALIFAVIVIRAKKIVQTIRQADLTRAQLSGNLLHASKLAAIGELASGVAHEINNPLAIINEKVGLMQDLMDPRFRLQASMADFAPHLESIREAVFRCRDITSKLLTFVRKDEIDRRLHDLHGIIDEVVHSFYSRDMAPSNIEILRRYCAEAPQILVDRTQLEEVFLNLINNAIDAIEDQGTITIATVCLPEDRVRIDIEDTGTGMNQEQLQKIFHPFFTTKQAGKGTGLGLSISYAIIQSLAGEVSVASTVGMGSVFSITLPSQPQSVNSPREDGGGGIRPAESGSRDRMNGIPGREQS